MTAAPDKINLLGMSQDMLEQFFADFRVMNANDSGHELFVGELDEVKDAASEEWIRQLLLGVRGDNDDRTVSRTVAVTGLDYGELHHIEFVQEIVGKLEISLVDLVDQKHHLLLGGQRTAERAELDVLANVRHVVVSETAVL